MNEEDVKVAPESEGEGTIPAPTPVPGEKTDPALLLVSLKEEREKRRIAEEAKLTLEQELQALRDVPENGMSEEGQLLKKEITSLEEKIALKDLTAQYTVLEDKASEFQEFRKAYPSISIERVAKLFLSENNLLEPVKPRKGLEPTRGGEHVAPKIGYTPDEVDKLRETNYRLYSQKLKAGEFRDVFK